MTPACLTPADWKSFTWLEGPLGNAVAASLSGRLKRFIIDRESEPIALFDPAVRAESEAGDWYGEHAGKWLCAASQACKRTGDQELFASLSDVVRALCEWQEEDGSLSTARSGAPCRMTHPEAGGVRTWDVWIHAWTIRGLLAAARAGVHPEMAFDAAEKACDLAVRTIVEKSAGFIKLGNHQGLSAAIVVDALAEASLDLHRPELAEAALQVLSLLEESGVCILSGPKSGLDAAQLGTGKAYQIIWLLLGMVKLGKATSRPELIDAAAYWWQNIHDHHLTPFGGPWGGIAGHHEVFNPRGFFSPEGFVETCSTATWISLSRELFLQTGDPKYASACETSLLNGILGAMDANGEDWSYFTFPNGRRNSTYHWACCKSSGALALEEAAILPLLLKGDALVVSLWQPFRAEFDWGMIELKQEERDAYRLTIVSTAGEPPLVELVTPAWAEDALLDDLPMLPSLTMRPEMGGSQSHKIRFSVKTVVQSFTYVQHHHGQEIVRTDYACLRWGPYVYAHGLIEGYRKQETVRIARLFPLNSFAEVPGSIHPSFSLKGQGRTRIQMEPFYVAGGQHDGAYRSLWLQVAWQ